MFSILDMTAMITLAGYDSRFAVVGCVACTTQSKDRVSLIGASCAFTNKCWTKRSLNSNYSYMPSKAMRKLALFGNSTTNTIETSVRFCDRIRCIWWFKHVPIRTIFRKKKNMNVYNMHTNVHTKCTICSQKNGVPHQINHGQS